MTDLTAYLAECRRMEQAATAGPWSYDDGRTDGDERGKPAWIMTRNPLLLVACPDGSDDTRDGTPSLEAMDANSALIARMRNTYEALLEVAEHANAVVSMDAEFGDVGIVPMATLRAALANLARAGGAK